MRSLPSLTALLAGLTWIACSPDLTVGNKNAGSLNDLADNPTATAVATATQGIFDQSRNLLAQFYIVFTGELGREGYCMDPTNPDCVTHPLIEGPDPGRYEVTSLYYPPWVPIRMANVVLKSVERVAGLTDQQKEGVRGAAKTMKALNFIYLIGVFDQSGLPIDVDREPGSALAPVVSKAEVFTYIGQLLDQAKTHLQGAGATFAFRLPPGFAGFTTPATFLQFNRALRTRVDIYANNYSAALTDVSESFINTSQGTLTNMNLGVYHSFGTASGDVALQQFVYDPTSRIVMAHAALETDAQLRADGTADLRYQRKVTRVTRRTLQGVTADLGFTIYNSPSAPVPIIRNEELVLLRAEANIALGNTSAAIADINFVRAASGGLPAISDPYVPVGNQPAALLDEVLYEKRYSLLWEGHRWIDMRHYGKLAELPKYAANHRIYPYWPLAQAECVPRTPPPAGCTTPTPL
ncbi:MAG: RagB/SusD family nutrient uptake outer membrane protein [Gemmatimonadetes bacterium]|nr:RagB/SusD family nutrient uptake outer membrane protein [Gemmatimonadota bacterium]